MVLKVRVNDCSKCAWELHNYSEQFMVINVKYVVTLLHALTLPRVDNILQGQTYLLYRMI